MSHALQAAAAAGGASSWCVVGGALLMIIEGVNRGFGHTRFHALDHRLTQHAHLGRMVVGSSYDWGTCTKRLTQMRRRPNR